MTGHEVPIHTQSATSIQQNLLNMFGAPPLPPPRAITQIYIKIAYYFNGVGRDDSVGIATRYELDGPGIESRRRQVLPRLSRTALGPTQPLCKGYGVFPRCKATRARGWPTHLHPAPRLFERVELHFYFSSVPSWPVLRWTLTFIILIGSSVSKIIRIKWIYVV